MVLRSAGFVVSGLVRSQNVLNFGYALYLKLRSQEKYEQSEIESYVRRWMVMPVRGM